MKGKKANKERVSPKFFLSEMNPAVLRVLQSGKP